MLSNTRRCLIYVTTLNNSHEGNRRVVQLILCHHVRNRARSLVFECFEARLLLNHF